MKLQNAALIALFATVSQAATTVDRIIPGETLNCVDCLGNSQNRWWCQATTATAGEYTGSCLTNVNNACKNSDGTEGTKTANTDWKSKEASEILMQCLDFEANDSSNTPVSSYTVGYGDSDASGADEEASTVLI